MNSGDSLARGESTGDKCVRGQIDHIPMGTFQDEPYSTSHRFYMDQDGFSFLLCSVVQEFTKYYCVASVTIKFCSVV